MRAKLIVIATWIASGALFGALLACSGMSGAPGGAPAGGAVGEGPGGAIVSGGGSGSGGGGAGGGSAPGPLTLSGPLSAASGGIMPAPPDSEAMGDCDPKGMLLYDKDYAKTFDTPTDFAAGLPWMQDSDQPFVGNFSVVTMGGTNVTGMQVRALRLSADRSKVSYRDFILNQTVPPHHPFTVEFSAPAAGERVELYYYPLKRFKTEKPEDPECVAVKTDDFNEAWVTMNKADFDAAFKKNWKMALASFNIEIFYRVDHPPPLEFDFSITK